MLVSDKDQRIDEEIWASSTLRRNQLPEDTQDATDATDRNASDLNWGVD